MDKLEDIIKNVELLIDNSLQTISKIKNLDELEHIRVSTLGKRGSISILMGLICGFSSNDARKKIGLTLNDAKITISDAINVRKIILEEQILNERLGYEQIDITLPVRNERVGRIHPISQTIDEVIAIFGQMGFILAEGPDIENDENNFKALNFPDKHPARRMFDTFFLPGKRNDSQLLLRTHTSTVQVRTMLIQNPPIRIISPGRVYRRDFDMTHTPMFNQVEGLVIEKTINMSHLKGCLIEFVKTYFEIHSVPVRFRPSFFPFTEPSAEVDIGCLRNNGELKIGLGTDWLEILGCGMVHPEVLSNCNIDPSKYQGFAFGMGIERIAMLKYGIPDLRNFFCSDLRWLKHYGFMPLDIPTILGGLSR
ncbi:MAG: phenylalanine--tRNA ligase subunit alpha [Rhodospirillaceae bacterium]|jgi:phenylalanyl-tRNA synthetase alpha chain|nr:phenylalanine--tRNA ligase subunit alpha [Rhodospirillaceae bacterium]